MLVLNYPHAYTKTRTLITLRLKRKDGLKRLLGIVELQYNLLLHHLRRRKDRGYSRLFSNYTARSVTLTWPLIYFSFHCATQSEQHSERNFFNKVNFPTSPSQNRLNCFWSINEKPCLAWTNPFFVSTCTIRARQKHFWSRFNDETKSHHFGGILVIG